MTMTDSSTIRRQPDMQALAAAAGYFAMVLGALVLVGWWWRIDFLKRVGEGLISMNPLTALCCICAGISLVMQVRGPVPLARALVGLITAIGVLKLGAYLFEWSFPLDRLMFPAELPFNEPVLMNRIAPNTALSLILLGAGLLTLDGRMIQGIRLAETFSMALALIALLVIVGYIYPIGWLFGIASFNPMALHTAVTLLVLSLGIVIARPDRGLMAAVMSDRATNHPPSRRRGLRGGRGRRRGDFSFLTGTRDHYKPTMKNQIILLVEDNPDDRDLTLMALEKKQHRDRSSGGRRRRRGA